MTLLGGLFDYDGVIGDTKARQFEWYKEWARQNKVDLKFPDGSKVDPNDLEGFLAQYNSTYALNGTKTYNLFGLPCDFDAENSKVWAAYELFNENNPVKIFPGMKEALIKIWKDGRLDSDDKKNRSLRLAINTTSSWKSIYPALKRFGISHIFDSYCTSEILKKQAGEGGKYEGNNKPSKVSIALMLNILGSRGNTTIHVGDTIADLRASQDVLEHLMIKDETLITVGVAWGYDGGEVLHKGYNLKDNKGNSLGTLNFNHIIEHPSQLPALIKKYR
ncbi:MAG TPA: HAD hydrolase-like protein [Alphaproteobacteria bacterium]|nr:HAD hydrolase-like protein [Alphaproteobacteria bacterium]